MSDQPLDPISVNSLTEALLKASGESTTAPAPSNRPTPAERSKHNLRRIHAETGLECPKCGYEGPESDFDSVELDEDSEGFETDDATKRTDGDDPVEDLAKALLKSANASYQKQSQTPQTGKALTAEEATKLIRAALKNLRR